MTMLVSTQANGFWFNTFDKFSSVLLRSMARSIWFLIRSAKRPANFHFV
jgi:hypothetical protein